MRVKKTVRLAEPVEHGGQTWDALTFRNVTHLDIAEGHIDLRDEAHCIATTSVFTGAPPEALSNLSQADFEACLQKILALSDQYARNVGQ